MDKTPARKELDDLLATLKTAKGQIEGLLKQHDQIMKDVLDKHWEGFE